MRISFFILFIWVCLSVISCNQNKSKLKISVSNYSLNNHKIKILVDSNIFLNEIIEVDKAVPFHKTLKQDLLSIGTHYYKIEYDNSIISDSFNFKKDSYLFLNFRNDLNPLSRKDSLTIVFMVESEYNKIELY